ncbi:FHA domain-containing protein [Prosthecobacter sp.]|uniref:FHA domain-containing protein n=1 Tax=Prosthecobacter sp. TaxID=1965333 RepID=UPI001D7952B0|nr:FHA domain-containing protein [Prosthecobacter sp.]MCB1277122.1 FHA domain-containing protein [Prosthecobacter sp.]
MAKLTFVLEDGQEVVVPLKEHIAIGREEDNDIVVDDERISPHHAEIVQNADGSLQVFDLKSASGTFVNGEKQLSSTLLHGDTLAFGPLVGTLDLEDPATAAPPPPKTTAEETTTTPGTDSAEEVSRLVAEKARLKAEVEEAEKELRDWQQRAEKERALHLARVESLRAEETKLEPVKTAVQQAESAHREWLETIATLSDQHAEKAAALERLNAQHFEKSTELQRLTELINKTQEEAKTFDQQKEEAQARLQKVRDECEQDEGLLNSLRQQIIEHEKRIVEEEAKHAALNAACTALSVKQQRDEAAVKDLEALLMSLEQSSAAAEGALQRLQEEHAGHEQNLASHKAEFASCRAEIAAELQRLDEVSARRAKLDQECQELAARHTKLTAEEQHLEKVKAQRAELEQQCQELAGTKQHLADTKQQLTTETLQLNEVRTERAELERQCQELADTKQQLADARQRLAAVEQRYRDVQANGSQSAAQMAVPKRSPAPENASKPDELASPELAAKIEAARSELAELEAKIAALRSAQVAIEGESEPAGHLFPPPEIVQVETIRLKPIPIKSERTRGASARKGAATAKSGKSA